MRVGWETARALVHVEAQNTGEKVLINSLGVAVSAVSSALVSERDIKISIGSEMKVPSVVVIYVLIELRDEWHLRIRQGLVRVGGRDLEAREAIVKPGASRGCGVQRAPSITRSADAILERLEVQVGGRERGPRAAEHGPPCVRVVLAARPTQQSGVLRQPLDDHRASGSHGGRRELKEH